MREIYSRNYFSQKSLKKSQEVQGPKCIPHFLVADIYSVQGQLICSFEPFNVQFT